MSSEFPNEQSCLRLIRALAVEIHEDWIEAHRYLNMEMLREQRSLEANHAKMASLGDDALARGHSNGVRGGCRDCSLEANHAGRL
jgi:hypothetical protein